MGIVVVVVVCLFVIVFVVIMVVVIMVVVVILVIVVIVIVIIFRLERIVDWLQTFGATASDDPSSGPAVLYQAPSRL